MPQYLNKAWEVAKNRMKGGFGESIVEALLQEAGNKVLRSGQEWKKIGDVSVDSFKFVELDPATRIRPDFAVLTKDKEIIYVDAKFMSSADNAIFLEFDKNLPELCIAWPKTTYIIVAPDAPSLFTLDPHIINQGEFASEHMHALWEEKRLGVTEILCKKYADIIQGVPYNLLKSFKGTR